MRLGAIIRERRSYLLSAHGQMLDQLLNAEELVHGDSREEGEPIDDARLHQIGGKVTGRHLGRLVGPLH